MAEQGRRAVGRMQETGAKAQEQAEGVMQKAWQKAPNSRQVIGLVTILTAAGIALGIGGMLLVGTIIAFVVGTPVFLFFSPVLVPLGIVLFLIATGVLSFGGVVVATLSFLSWVYKYFKGRNPVGSDRLDAAKHRLVDGASHAKDRAQEGTGYLQETGGRAQEQAQGVLQKAWQKAPTSRQVSGLVTLLTAAGIALGIAGMLLVGTIIAFVVGTPVFLFFSPVLVPLGIVLFLIAAGFLSFGGGVVATLSFLGWVYNYFKGRHPIGSDSLEASKHRIVDVASHAKERAQDFTGLLQQKASDAAPGA